MYLDYCLDLEKKLSVGFNNTSFFEDKQLPFSIFSAGHYTAKSGYFTKRAGLSDFLLLYTVSGSGLIEFSDTSFSLYKNMYCIIDCNQFHHYKTNDETWEFYWFHFSSSNIDTFLKLLQNDRPYGYFYDEFFAQNVFYCIFKYIDNFSAACNVYLSNEVSNLFTEMIRANNSVFLNDLHKPQIDHAISYIKENYSTISSTDEICKNIFISKFYFLKLFKQYVGTSLYDYLLKYRISVARTMLKTTDIPVSVIATSVGFNDSNSFIRCFKLCEGTTPLKYRRLDI